jgi:hypothetical protein
MKNIYSTITYDNGVIEKLVNGKTHCDDGPAVVYPDGRKEWYANDYLHRISLLSDKPAIVYPNGRQEWWFEGRRHNSENMSSNMRSFSPAIISPDGSKVFYYHGIVFDGTSEDLKKKMETFDVDKQPRVSIKKFRTQNYTKHDKIVYDSGTISFKTNNELHGYPAIIRANGVKEYYTNGRRDRKGGPAIDNPNGHKEWYYLGNLHREDGPAVILEDGTETWYYHGHIHNGGQEGIDNVKKQIEITNEEYRNTQLRWKLEHEERRNQRGER